MVGQQSNFSTVCAFYEILLSVEYTPSCREADSRYLLYDNIIRQCGECCQSFYASAGSVGTRRECFECFIYLGAL